MITAMIRIVKIISGKKSDMLWRLFNLLSYNAAKLVAIATVSTIISIVALIRSK